MIRLKQSLWILLFAFLIPASPASGQAASTPPVRASGASAPRPLDGPPAPVPPEVVSRDSSGRVTLRAVKLTAPLNLDGKLDEDIYRSVPAISDFIQSEPDPGVPASQKTEIWILYDRDNIYVSARCWETNPERMIINEMRRDAANIGQNERIGFTLDTFHDRRNGVSFSITPIGGRSDGQITDERQYNADWNPIWDLGVGRFEGGWMTEVQIPFKSLRYRADGAQVWGINITRHNRWKNEIAYLTPIPPSVRGLFQISLGATLVGLEVPPGSRNLEVKPYVTSDLTSVRTGAPSLANDANADAGVDVKYGLTQSLTADVTYNTDFAQVEADEQQINLTRFSLFFPEKREFFLENQGTFAFGGTPAQGQAVVGGDMPVLFYSRRIGLNAGRAVPIDLGGRLTGRLGRFTLGALNIQAGDEPQSATPATNFSVVRVKRDLFRRSSIGLIFTGRSIGTSGTGAGANQAFGGDGTFAFFDNLSINTYWARTHTDGRSGDDMSYRAQLDYAGDRYGVQLERLVIGDNFNPEVGFVRRDDMRRSFGLLRFSPRLKASPRIRKFSGIGTWTYIENGAGRLETREVEGDFGIEFHNADQFSVGLASTYEFLPQPFRVGSQVTLPVGGYDFATGRASFTLGQRRTVSGTIALESGTFYNGRKTAIGYSRGRVNITPQFSVEPNISINWVDLDEGAFVTHLIGSRVTYAMNTRMFVSALMQYSAEGRTTGVNARLRWEYRPGSELFVVYNEQRDAIGERWTSLASRAFIVKINRLFRF